MDDPQSPEESAGQPPIDRQFAEEAQQPAPSLWAEYWDFLIHNKKWWLTPIIVIILLAGLLVILASTVGPFIYPGL